MFVACAALLGLLGEGVLAVAVTEAKAGIPQLRGKSFAQLKLASSGKLKLPTDDDDDGYEYGDKEFHARDADSSDYSVHQFLTADDGRDGTKSDDDDQAFVMRREKALAKEDHFNSEETPSTDNFLQLESTHRRTQVQSSRKKLPGDEDDDGDGYEYGDREFHARDADSSDYSVHQFLTADDGRDGTKSDDDDQGFVMRREQALAKEDHFNSEETPSTDNFLQLASRAKAKTKLPADDDEGYEYGDQEFHARDADSSDYSVHQFLATDDGRDGTRSGDDDQAFEMRRSQALAKEDHFNSEDTPSTDNFLQLATNHRRTKVQGSKQLPGDDDDGDGYEYGDREFHARDADSSDYSVHQFLTADDGRDGTKSDDDDQQFVMRRSQALAKEDHFNSEETPSTDNFIQVKAGHATVKARGRQLPGDDDDDGYEYGDKEFHARDADSSDYSVHQFLTADDGRDGTKSDDDDQTFVMRREKALAKEDHFNSEETPSTDNFVQLSSVHGGRKTRAIRGNQSPGDDDDDGYEYGDKEFHARDADSSDYSVHQFITTDDGRDGTKSDDDDQAFAMRRSQALAKEDHFNSEETPSTGFFLQLASTHRRTRVQGVRKKLPGDEDDDSDGYEYGDREFHARDADSSDYSVHQFITTDDGRDGTKSDDDDQNFAMRRSQALAKEDHFNSEETPSTDNFVQLSSTHSGIVRYLRKEPVDAAGDGYEYGDSTVHAADADSSDYSVHQFLGSDDGRDTPKADEDQAAETRRSEALAKEDHFGSEDTPSTE